MIIVPAKAKSRRLPGKNAKWIDRLLGKLQYDVPLISTDSPFIAWRAGRWGNKFIERPANLSRESATVEDVCRHIAPTSPRFCVVLPTAALITLRDIHLASKMLHGRIDTVIAVTRHYQSGKQCVADCGAFIWCKTKPFMKRRSFYDSKNIAVYVLPFSRGQDVDTPKDAERVDWLLSQAGAGD